MGAAEEKLVMEFLRHGEGREMDVDAQERNTIFEMGDKRITLRLAAVLEIVDGKIAAWREYFDTADLARQLGVDPGLLVEE
jgi:limonene-1,2-epoxide hydrolase